MSTRGDWEQVRQLGSGGQSDVWLVRQPLRQQQREKAVSVINKFVYNNSEPLIAGLGVPDSNAFAQAVAELSRPETSVDLGAMKVFKSRAGGAEAEAQALQRLKCEITVLGQDIPGLLKLLDANEEEKWIVTEYHPRGSLEKTRRYSRETSVRL